MIDFIANNYVSILCNYNRSNSEEILFNVRKIVSEVFNDNCNVISKFRNDYTVLENVFIPGQDIINRINEK
jgi:hypothetical protein